MQDLKDKVVLITGGASGIGLATAGLFAELGAHVAIADIAEEAVISAAEALGAGVLPVLVDVADPDSCVAMVETVKSQLGRLDCAFNNAGITEVSVLGPEIPESHELPLDAWRKIMAVDVDGVFNCVRAELPLMLQNGEGAIVNTASLQSVVSFPRTVAYTAAKHAVAGITKTIAKEYGGQGVRCNAVVPGIVDTPLTHDILRMPEYRDALLAQIPSARFANGEDIGRAVVWLCSEGSQYVNGVMLPIDGGYLA